MIVYDYRCDNGHRFEAWVDSMSAADPDCECGAASRRRPAAPRLRGASAGLARHEVPNSWRGTGGGDKETLRHFHTEMTKREKLEARYPELAGDRRPVLAHEGVFHDSPLRAGDAQASAVAASTFSSTNTPSAGAS